MMIYKVFIFGFFFFPLFHINAQEIGQIENLYEHQVFIKNNDTLKYRILRPKDFSKNKKYSMVLFLHGAGERGFDNKKQLVHGASLFASDKNISEFPAIVIFPQCREDDFWSNAKIDTTKRRDKRLIFQNGGEPTESLRLVMQMMDDFVAKPYVNEEKVYVAGLSMGGMGTFEILHRRPNMFAAAIAICGGGNEEVVPSYSNRVPVWVFHGAKDDVVNPAYSVRMVNTILENGGFPKFTLYDNANHNSWDPAFAEPDFLPWLFSKSKTLSDSNE